MGKKQRQGFTLIELSIVLVIIGLIVGGILVGRDMIDAATIRAQISQIEKYNTAVNTFRVKYGYLPGDIPDPVASQIGLAARGTQEGEGDGNGVLEGVNAGSYSTFAAGETTEFWVDLSYANGRQINLIDGSFSKADPLGNALLFTTISGDTLGSFLPKGIIGNGNYVYTYSLNNINYFGVSAVTSIASGWLFSLPGMSVTQANNIDTKIDDGLPQSGRVTARYIDTAEGAYNPVYYAWAGSGDPGHPYGMPNTNGTSPSATTCYDNGNVAGTQHYSTEVSNGSGINCALSFRFQ